MVTRDLREVQINPAGVTPRWDETSPHIDKSDDSPMRALEELPFCSVWQIASAMNLPVAAVDRWMSEPLRLGRRHL
jgi:hypothetical protein